MYQQYDILPFPIGEILKQLLARDCQHRCTATPKAHVDDENGFYPLPQVVTRGFYCPPVDRVIFNDDTTVVVFKDGTKSVVVREPNDKNDRTTAVAYAIAKRTLATAYNAKTSAVNAAYINTIRNIVANGYDQAAETANAAARERDAKAEHEARQKQEHDAAFERKARARAEELRLEARARQILEEDSLNKTKKKVLTENAPAEQFFKENDDNVRTSGLLQIDSKDAWKTYRRPNKPFSQFTDEEKKLYWRMNNAKRRAKK